MRVARRVPFRKRKTSVGCVCALSEYAIQFTIQNLYGSVQMRNVFQNSSETVLDSFENETRGSVGKNEGVGERTRAFLQYKNRR